MLTYRAGQTLLGKNDPRPIRFDGKPPIFDTEGIKVASISLIMTPFITQ